ncbi:MAG: NAD(P)/FAD-dependent oxidoreductase [Halioglobus sp.]|nr:NAD(P)/FAD-dependent oxidoreductase [Halioglobus sp.]
MKIAVIGGGPMGLAAAYELLQHGHSVTLYEADDRLGGMSASFVFNGIKIERYYHFICKADQPMFDMLEELGIADTLRWRVTRMGYYYLNKIRDWGEPIALLRFPGLDIVSKIRYGLLAFTSTKRKDWTKLDSIDAVTWLKKWVGDRAYEVLWHPLFDLKFYHYTPNLSAAWIWSRLRRVGTSRRNIFQEEMGYLEGGSDTFLDRIAQVIAEKGGNILLQQRVEEVLIDGDRVQGVRTGEGTEHYDQVISTIPMPYVSDMIPALPAGTRAGYDSVNNIAVVCVLVHLAQPLTKYFWLNISDPDIDIPGFIEYSNLNPGDGHIVYAPFYIPGEHPDYQREDEFFIEKVRRYLKMVNPDLPDAAILKIAAGRYRYAQPICEPEFAKRLPPISPGVDGLYVADTCYYYPEDRSISESVQLGRKLARMAAGIA